MIETAPALAGLKSVEPLTNPVVISDLHLTPSKPKTIMAFLRFMKTVAPRYQELVILGDLFDFWIGDDAMGEAEAIVKVLKLHSMTGRRVLVMPGNRDVMIGREFAEAVGGELLSDPIKVNIKGVDVLLAHGDEWCLKDVQYQQFRAMCRNPNWQMQMLSKTPQERIALAQQARMQSESDKNQKSDDVMDVVESAVAQAARDAGVRIVIHGHTHRPRAHVGAMIERWVLPDWELDGPAGTERSGCITFMDDGRPQIKMLSLNQMK